MTGFTVVVKVLAGQRPTMSADSSPCSASIRALITKGWQYDPTQRPSASDIEHILALASPNVFLRRAEGSMETQQSTDKQKERENDH